VYPFKEQNIWMILTMSGEMSENSAPFSNTSLPSKRNGTSTRLLHISNKKWEANKWVEIKSATGKDFTEIVQEIVNQQSWEPGNSLSLIFQGYGLNWQRKFVNSYSRNPLFAPKLTITYQ